MDGMVPRTDSKLKWYLAQLPLAFALGRVRGLDIRDRIVALLVHGDDS